MPDAIQEQTNDTAASNLNLEAMTPLEILELTEEVNLLLQQERMAYARVIAPLNDQLESIQGEVRRRYSSHMDGVFKEFGKYAGKVHQDQSSGVRVTAEITKTVKWDDRILKALAAEMPWHEAQHVFKIKFSVPESTYNALMPESALQLALKEARTIKLSDPVLSLSRVKKA